MDTWSPISSAEPHGLAMGLAPSLPFIDEETEV